MGLRRARRLLHRINLPQGDDVNKQLFYRSFLARRDNKGWLKTWTTSRKLNWTLVFVFSVGGGLLFGPWAWTEMNEALGYNVTIVSPSHMVRTTPLWWENEWRVAQCPWRRGESFDEFYKEPFAYIQEVTGRDIAASSGPSVVTQGTANRSSFFGKRKSANDTTAKPASMRALVPLCGDTPMLLQLARLGYSVDGVDCSETALKNAVERTELLLRKEEYSRINLHWSDIFNSVLWNKELANVKFDLIWDRQALSALNPEQRSDYAYLMKQALKDDGVMYVEGIFRTGRVKGNKVRGPPYGLSRANLRELFPEREGFFVQCKDVEDDAVTKLDTESRVLRRVPKELYTTSYPCVVYRSQALNKQKSKETVL